MGPRNAFEMMVWERLFAAILSNANSTCFTEVLQLAKNADSAFEEYSKRHQEMMRYCKGDSK